MNNFKAQKYLNCVLELLFGVEYNNIFLWKKYSNKYLIETGIGLQDVDGLKDSTYFLSHAIFLLDDKFNATAIKKSIR